MRIISRRLSGVGSLKLLSWAVVLQMPLDMQLFLKLKFSISRDTDIGVVVLRVDSSLFNSWSLTFPLPLVSTIKEEENAGSLQYYAAIMAVG